jgi:tRNA pseudouridine38-40 synthase
LTRYLVTLEYRGSQFHGFQKQPGLPTIQGALEAALVSLTGEEIRAHGAGRTDTGVHSLGQTAVFDLPFEADTDRTVVSLNALLPGGVSVSSMRKVRDGFDPRREALWREYRYFILNRAAPSALLDDFTYHFPWSLDRKLMDSACEAFLGEHDFSAFRAKSQEEGSVRKVLRCEVVEVFDGVLSFVVRADSFLYKMVRILAGALTSVGSGRMTLEELEGHLAAASTGPCADPLPARGLFLWRVAYPPESGSGLES